ncbi:hypothetical protein E2320_014442 [Naja naja]|nr:hypothetical protein E2320_014442 [Naja naja]
MVSLEVDVEETKQPDLLPDSPPTCCPQLTCQLLLLSREERNSSSAHHLPPMSHPEEEVPLRFSSLPILSCNTAVEGTEQPDLLPDSPPTCCPQLTCQLLLRSSEERNSSSAHHLPPMSHPEEEVPLRVSLPILSSNTGRSSSWQLSWEQQVGGESGSKSPSVHFGEEQSSPGEGVLLPRMLKSAVWRPGCSDNSPPPVDDVFELHVGCQLDMSAII